ncbi:TRAP transporter small permease [Chloroflexota bacterium]
MKLLTKVVSFFDYSVNAFAFLAAIILVFLWGLLSAEVILRFLTGNSILWYIEISENFIFIIAFLSAAWLLKKEGHIKIDIISSQLKPKAQALLNASTSIIGIIICLLLVWSGLQVAIDDFQRNVLTTTVLQHVTWPIYAIIALGMLLLFYQFCRRTYNNLIIWRKPESKENLVSKELTEY